MGQTGAEARSAAGIDESAARRLADRLRHPPPQPPDDPTRAPPNTPRAHPRREPAPQTLPATLPGAGVPGVPGVPGAGGLPGGVPVGPYRYGLELVRGLIALPGEVDASDDGGAEAGATSGGASGGGGSGGASGGEAPGLLGMTDLDRQMMYVSDVAPPAKRLSVFWHEWAHAAKAELDITDAAVVSEEALCDLIGLGMAGMSPRTLAMVHVYLTHGMVCDDVLLIGGGHAVPVLRYPPEVDPPPPPEGPTPGLLPGGV